MLLSLTFGKELSCDDELSKKNDKKSLQEQLD